MSRASRSLRALRCALFVPLLGVASLFLPPVLLSQASAQAERPDLEDAGLATYLGEALTQPRIDGVPRPETVVGFDLGSWHLRPEQIETYFRRLADASPRVALEVTGHTHERRPLLLATITSARNHARLEQIRARQRALTDPELNDPELSSGIDTGDLPAVVYLAYSVHGNEPSGSNAAPIVAWQLASSRDPEVVALLDDVVILLDPVLNPDGLARFAHWANSHRGKVAVADPEHREHREPWPSGRTNHYLFDLNRDWLLARQPESRARLATFHRWRPNLLADFHEMGRRATYFFQPGVPSRTHPLTPRATVALTEEIATYHARALDRLGSLYFTEQIFDDFYYGKGSTYPDLHGAVGVLFEQASARGHRQEAPDGTVISFPFAIRNQVAASFSTLEAARALRPRLLEHQRAFYREALAEARASKLGGYVVGDDGDPARLAELVDLLRLHGVEVRPLTRALETADSTWRPGHAVVVPHAQAQARLVRAIFEERVDCPDETFYDVSAWTLPHSFGLPFAAVDSAPLADLAPGGRETADADQSRRRGSFAASPDALAYAFGWHDLWAPRALRRLLDADVRVRVALEPLDEPLEVSGTGSNDSALDSSVRGPSMLGRGTIVVPLGIQDLERDAIETLLAEVAHADGLDIVGLDSGLARARRGAVGRAGSRRLGLDLGSPSLAPLRRPTPALVVGESSAGTGSFGVSAYETGELWHLLDARYGVAVTLLEADRLARADLSRYSHLIVADGSRRGPSEPAVEAIRRWVRAGGVLIATRDAAAWAERQVLRADEGREANGGVPQEDPEARPRERAPDRLEAAAEPPERRPYGQRDADAARDLVSGALVEVELDLTHPLAFGYHRDRLTVFRRGTRVLPPARDPYSAVAVYTASPLVAGYASSENLGRLAGTPALLADRLGRGTVVRFGDNPAFRGVWHGTEKLVLNALFFGDLVDNTTGRTDD
ncbi:MAG: M14 metallopeptidase family protein [Acidobacteriota bacterium]